MSLFDVASSCAIGAPEARQVLSALRCCFDFLQAWPAFQIANSGDLNSPFARQAITYSPLLRHNPAHVMRLGGDDEVDPDHHQDKQDRYPEPVVRQAVADFPAEVDSHNNGHDAGDRRLQDVGREEVKLVQENQQHERRESEAEIDRAYEQPPVEIERDEIREYRHHLRPGEAVQESVREPDRNGDAPLYVAADREIDAEKKEDRVRDRNRAEHYLRRRVARVMEERYAGVKPGERGQVQQPEAAHALAKTLRLRDQHDVRQKRREDDERDCDADVDEARYHGQA